MGLYEIKMHIKRLPFVKLFLSYRIQKEYKKKRMALRDNGINTIKVVENALKDFNVKFFADYGTLLGIIRDHDFIKWDNDIDYGIIVNNDFCWTDFEHHMNKYGFKKIREFFLDGHIKEQTYKIDILTVDFFAKSHEEDGDFVTYGFFKLKDFIYSYKQDYHVRRVKYTDVESTKQVAFLGSYVTVPDNAEQYLESVYSKNWRIPDPEWDDDSEKREVKILDTLGKGVIVK